MAVAHFGNFQVDMTNDNFLDLIFGSNFDQDPGISVTPTEVTEFFPSGAKVVIHGNFTQGLNSAITGTDVYNPPGDAFVLSITGLSGVTVGSIVNLSFSQVADLLFDQVNEVFTQGFPDILVGDDSNEIAHAGGGDDTIQGNGGNDILDGGAGADHMVGGTGNDTYFVDNTGDVVVEEASGGFDTEQSSIDRTIDANVEQLVLIGGANNATGDDRPNALTGNGGNNVLDGGRGADSMAGGAGDDIYQVDFGLDQVSEAAGQGSDTVLSEVPQVLAANVESLTLGASAGNIAGIGNAAANTIIGNNSANLLDGGAGNDTLKGQGGDDTLLGGDGVDNLSGGLGRDVLVGGAGADHFVFDSAIAAGTNVDQIVDFVHGQDVIDLSAAIFAGAGAPGNFAGATLVSEPGALAHTADQHIIHDTNTGTLYYDADGSGAQHMVAFAQVTPGQILAAADFHVVA